MIKPLTLANTFLDRFAGEVGIQHMKLQKLCYYADGWWLSVYEAPLLDERPEVWRYGPVYSGLYRELKSFGNSYITRPQALFPNAPEVVTDPEQSQLVDWIWRKYGDFSAVKLSEMTHAKETPWRKVAERYNFKVPLHCEIPDADMLDYFKTLKEAGE